MQQNYVKPGTQPMPMFTIGQIKKIALTRLKGKWKKALIPTIVYVVLTVIPATVVNVITMPQLQLVGYNTTLVLSIAYSIYNLLLTGALAVSMSDLSLRIIRNEDFGTDVILYGFSKYTQSLAAYLLIGIFSFLWLMLFIFPGSIAMGLGMMTESPFFIFITSAVFMICTLCGIIYVMRYEMTYFIVADYGQVKANHAVTESIRLMQNNIFSFTALQLSFIGWAILAALPASASVGLFYLARIESSTGYFLLALLLGIIGAAALSVFTIYNKTADAIFFSGISGNFRQANTEN